jgi:hypothetical protein
MFATRNRSNPLALPSSSRLSTEEVPPAPRKMSNSELLRFGLVAKHMCSKEADLGAGEIEAFELQLNDARIEWNRRFPKLPLSATFE